MLIFLENPAHVFNGWVLKDTVEYNVSEVFLLTFTKNMKIFRHINVSLDKRNARGNSANFNKEPFCRIKSHGKPQMFNVNNPQQVTKTYWVENK